MTDFDRLNAKADADGYVSLGDVAREFLNMQAQYAAWYVWGIGGSPDVTNNLRIKGGKDYMYHSLRIHKYDVPAFVERVNRHRGR